MKLRALMTVMQQQQRWWSLGLFLLALGLSSPHWLLPAAAPRFLAPSEAPTLPTTPLLPPESRLLPNPSASAHSVSLAPVGQEHVAAAWFAGSREGARDVTILFATFNGRNWSDPRTAVGRKTAQASSGRVLRKLGNPVLWQDPQGVLHLWYVSVSYGGWAGSSINHTQSADGGDSWSPPQRLITSPFWNLSTLVRSTPLPLADGGLILPVYHEFITKRAEWLRLDAQGRVMDKLRLPGTQKLLQPAAVALDDLHTLVLLRDASDRHRIHLSRSTDGGQHWQASLPTELPNPNAGIALLRLADGRLLLAYNPQSADRDRLALALSTDDGKSWSLPRLIEHGEEGEEFSYPSLTQDEQGMIHLAYTWKRERIKHLRFPLEWLKELR